MWGGRGEGQGGWGTNKRGGSGRVWSVRDDGGRGGGLVVVAVAAWAQRAAGGGGGWGEGQGGRETHKRQATEKPAGNGE